VLVQVGLNLAQAAQQGFLPDLAPASLRGRAAGIKGFMDMAGAMLGFVLLGEYLGRGQMLAATGIMAGLLAAGLALTVYLVKEKTNGKHAALSHLHLTHIFRLEAGSSRDFKRLVLARFFFLLGTYAIGRFLVYYVGDRLGLAPAQAAEQAGGLLAGLALATVVAAPVGGWLADRWGRKPLMIAGGLLSTAGVLGLIGAASSAAILGFGLLMSLGSGAFAGANWAATADMAPEDQGGRYFGLANLGAGGAAAAAGLFGPLIDAGDGLVPGGRYSVLFTGAALAFALSCLSAWAISSKHLLRANAPTTQTLSTAAGDMANVNAHDYVREEL
jgi:MFS-type transporter involved in bile tolerance (Atg22 family)